MNIDNTKCMCLIKDLSRQCGNPPSHGWYCPQHQNCPVSQNLVKNKPFPSPKMNPRQLTRLSGPSVFAHYYLPTMNKVLLFLGEKHIRDQLCTPQPNGECQFYGVSGWLKSLIPLTNHCIDVMAEDYYRTQVSVPNPRVKLVVRSGLDTVIELFRDCTGPVRQCFAGKVRYHYIDIRSITNQSISFDTYVFLRSVNDTTVNVRHIYTPEHYDSDVYLRLLHYAVGLDTTQSTMSLYENYYIDLLRTHLHEEVSSEMIDSARVHHTKAVALIAKQLNKLDPRLNRERFLSLLCNVSILLSRETRSYIELMNIQQDAYLLTRLFSVFPDKPSHSADSVPVHCRDAPTINHAIIYTGGTHTMVYINFINNLFHVKPGYYQNRMNHPQLSQCIEFSEPYDFYADMSP